MRNRLQSPNVAAALMAVLVLALGFAGLRLEQSSHLQDVRTQAVTTASRVRADLEKALEQRIFMVEGLAGYAVADLAPDGEISPERFTEYATLLDEDSGRSIRSLQLAPAGVVELVYPLEGNEAAVGHDLLEDPERRAAVMVAVSLRKPMVAGPFELLQGGLAIVVRKPVFWPSGPDKGEFWGLATMVADVPPLFAETGLDGSDPSLATYDIALRGVDQSGPVGAQFFGPTEVFASHGDPVLFEVTLPAGSWQMGLLPVGGWDALAWPFTDVYLVALFAVALGVGLLSNRYSASRADARRAAKELTTLVDTANAPIADLDTDGTVRRWNREMAELTGLRSADVLGKKALSKDETALLTQILTPASYTALCDVLCVAAVEHQDVEAAELVIERRDGTRTPVLVNVAPKTDDRGNITGIVVVCQDITAREDAERARAESEAIARTAKLKDQFLANMSHELRTPLNGIIGLSSILAKETFGNLNDKQAEYVGQVAASGRHLLALINDVLDLAKIEAESVQIQMDRIDLCALAGQATSLLRESALAAGHELTVVVPPIPVIVQGDMRRLRQIVLNLLSNAIKFTPTEGRIGVEVRSLAEGIELEVWDTGIGIADDQQHLLFEPFQQLDAKLDRVYEGSGLGLALTAKLAELHGGTIKVVSTPGEGSRFTLWLPRPPDQAAPSSANEATVAASPVEQPPQRGTIRVVVAEDNEINRLLLLDLLRAADIEVFEARDGIDAIAQVRAHRPDVVLMDVQMPRLDGLAATRQLKADPATAAIPVIAVTAFAMKGDAERCLDAGCDAYVSKPLDTDSIVALVRQFATPALDA